MFKDLSGSLLLIGGGKMGASLFTGWVQSGLNPKKVIIIEPNKHFAGELESKGALVFSSPDKIPNGFIPKVAILAVKPQVVSSIIGLYQEFVSNEFLLISIAAGVTIESLKKGIGNVPIIRAMPNTPAAIGSGITAAHANKNVTDSQRSICNNILGAVGEVVWIADESKMNAITAVSGSGPAYVFLLIECLSAAGVSAGLDPELSLRLAKETVAGSGELAKLSHNDPSILRENVTSPGGTTAAALEVLMQDNNGLESLINQAVRAAAERSRELSEE